MARRSLSFPRTRRLTRDSDFERVRREGRVYRGKILMVSVITGTEAARFHAGFISSGRIGSAVVRNRVRRRLREIVRHHQHEIGSGAWIVTIARPVAASASYRQLEDEWLRLAKRASILAA